MTVFNKEIIETMKLGLIGSKIKDFYFESDDDYFVIEMEDGGEMCFRFMADLVDK